MSRSGRKGRPQRRSQAGRGGGGRAGGKAGGGSKGGRGRGSSGREERAEKGLGGDRVPGRQAVREALIGPRRVREVLLAADLDPAPVLDEIVDLAAESNVRVTRVDRAEVDAASGIDAAQGVVARLDALEPRDADELARREVDGRPPFLVVLDGVTDPGNLGAVLR
ncbi:MAG: RNA methyltransferase substrate-binding domain-containing protein, partial [Actinomycetota bacterium]